MATITPAELNWLILALKHDLGAMKDVCEQTDDPGTEALAELAMCGRESLLIKLTDAYMKHDKTIRVKYNY